MQKLVVIIMKQKRLARHIQLISPFSSRFLFIQKVLGSAMQTDSRVPQGFFCSSHVL